MTGKTFPGAPVLLFDRLALMEDGTWGTEPGGGTDPGPLLSKDGQHLTLEGLHASVERELTRLLATRAPVDGDRLEPDGRTVLTYGIPDFGTLTESSGGNRDRLQRAVAAAIAAYEPRLQGVRVQITPMPADGAVDPSRPLRWQATVEGELVAGPRRIAARFVTPLRPGTPVIPDFAARDVRGL